MRAIVKLTACLAALAIALAFAGCAKPGPAGANVLCPVDGLSTYVLKEGTVNEFVRGDIYLTFAEKVSFTGETTTGLYQKVEMPMQKVVRADGTTVWTNARYLVPDGVVAVIIADDVLLYREPDITKNSQIFLGKGQLVGLFPGNTNGFVQVSGWSEKDKGFTQMYVKADQVSAREQDVTAIILLDKAKREKNVKLQLELLRSASSLGSAIFGMEIDTLIQTLGGNATDAGAAPAAAAEVRVTEAFLATGTIIGDNVRVRNLPNEVGTEVLATLSTGATVAIIEKTVSSYTIGSDTAPWFKISSPEGWVFGGFIGF